LYEEACAMRRHQFLRSNMMTPTLTRAAATTATPVARGTTGLIPADGLTVITSFFTVKKLQGAINLGEAFRDDGDGAALTMANGTKGDVDENGIPQSPHVALRQLEYAECLVQNILSPAVKRVVLLVEGMHSVVALQGLLDHLGKGPSSIFASTFQTRVASNCSRSQHPPHTDDDLHEAWRAKLVPIFHHGETQPLYSDLFALAPQLLHPTRDVAMVCNADVFVPPDFPLHRVRAAVGCDAPLVPNAAGSLSSTNSLDAPVGTSAVSSVGADTNNASALERTCLALSRYESTAEPGSLLAELSAPAAGLPISPEIAPLIADYRGSHDAFIFRPGDISDKFLGTVAHPQNAYKSENIVVHELRASAGLRVRNPCLDARVLHRHRAAVRQWLPPVDEERYGKAEPEPLWC
jgi:hypothetical protein